MRRIPGYSDPRLVRCEVYNPYSREIYVHLDEEQVPYIRAAGIMIGPRQAIIPADGFLILPHMYFRIVDYKGDIVNVLMNLGSQIGIGNKMASLPEMRTRYVQKRR